MAEQRRNDIHIGIKTGNGFHLFKVLGYPDCTFLETYEWDYKANGMQDWRRNRIIELTPAELDALIAALTKARALREDNTSC